MWKKRKVVTKNQKYDIYPQNLSMAYLNNFIILYFKVIDIEIVNK